MVIPVVFLETQLSEVLTSMITCMQLLSSFIGFNFGDNFYKYFNVIADLFHNICIVSCRIFKSIP